MADEKLPEQPSAPKEPAEGVPAQPAETPKSAAQPAAGAAAPAAKKPVAKKPVKKPAVMETEPWEDELTGQLKGHFGDQISEFSIYRGQKFLVAAQEVVASIIEFLKIEAEFDYLVDVTAVDYPKREERFELVYILYSFARNERIRIKTRVKEGDRPESVVGIHLTANWLEREVYDMFGIEFADHPDLKRILMPDEWEGFPLRKDSDILNVDEKWVKENLTFDNGQ